MHFKMALATGVSYEENIFFRSTILINSYTSPKKTPKNALGNGWPPSLVPV